MGATNLIFKLRIDGSNFYCFILKKLGLHLMRNLHVQRQQPL